MYENIETTLICAVRQLLSIVKQVKNKNEIKFAMVFFLYI
jgi:hypothetical protein